MHDSLCDSPFALMSSNILFLESLHSTLNTDAVNGRQPFPKSYLPFLVSLMIRDHESLETFLNNSF